MMLNPDRAAKLANMARDSIKLTATEITVTFSLDRDPDLFNRAVDAMPDDAAIALFLDGRTQPPTPSPTIDIAAVEPGHQAETTAKPGRERKALWVQRGKDARKAGVDYPDIAQEGPLVRGWYQSGWQEEDERLAASAGASGPIGGGLDEAPQPFTGGTLERPTIADDVEGVGRETEAAA